jgi:hypothetical protein
MKNHLAFLLVLVFARAVAFAQDNPCIETGPHFGTWTCGNPWFGSNSVSGTSCVEKIPGTPTTLPAPTVNWVFTPGQKSRTVSFDCAAATNESVAISYNGGSWFYYPDAPPANASVGTHSREIRVTYTSTDADCTYSQDFTVGTATWTVREAADSEDFCIQSGSITDATLSSNYFSICVSNAVDVSASYTIVSGKKGYYHTNACPNNYDTVTNEVGYEWYETLILDPWGNPMQGTLDVPGTYSFSVYVVIRKPEAGDPVVCADYITNFVDSFTVVVAASGVGIVCTGTPSLRDSGILDFSTFALCVNETVTEPSFLSPPTMNAGQITKFTTNCGPLSVTQAVESVEYTYSGHYFLPGFSSSTAGATAHAIMAIFERQGSDTNCSQYVTQSVGSVTLYVSSTPGQQTYCSGGPSLTTGATLTPSHFLICLGGNVSQPSASGIVFAPGTKDIVNFACENGMVESTITTVNVPFNPGNIRFENPPSSFNSTGTFTFKVFADAISSDGICANATDFEVGSYTVTVVNNNATNVICTAAASVRTSGSVSPSGASACLGESVSAPTVVLPSLNDGEKETITISCPDGASTRTRSAVAYTLGSYYWENGVAPSGVFTDFGTFTYTAKVDAWPSDANSTCSTQTFTIGTFTVTVTNAASTNEVCGLAGSVSVPGSISPTNLMLCVGGSADAPAVEPPLFSDGEVFTTTISCPDGIQTTVTNAVSYTFTNLVWDPPIPTTFSNSGYFTFTAKGTGKPSSSNCAPIQTTVGTFSVFVTNGWITNYSCLQPGSFSGPPTLSATNFTICAEGDLLPPQLSNLGINPGTYLISARNCTTGASNGVVETNGYSINRVTFNPEWPTNFISPGTNTFTVTVFAQANLLPDGRDCGEISTNVGTVTVVVSPQPVGLTLDGLSAEDEEDPGFVLFVNRDDDNNNGTNDFAEGIAVVVNENDLVPLTINASGIPANDPVTLSVTPAGGHIRIWLSSGRGPNAPVLDNGDPTKLSKTWDAGAVPALFVEGVGASGSVRDVILTVTGPSCPDTIAITVADPVLEYVTRDPDTMQEIPVDPVMFTPDPRPDVSLQLSGYYIDDSGDLIVSLSGTVSDRMSELAFNPAQRVQQLKFSVDGHLVSTIDNLPALAPAGSEWPWRPNIFTVNFQKTLRIPYWGGNGLLVHVETSPNAAGRTGWGEVSFACGWEAVELYYPGFGSGGGGGGSLATAGLSLAFRSIPTNTVVDTGNIYFGNRSPLPTDGRIVETSSNSLVFAGSIVVSTNTPSRPVRVSIQGGFNYTNGAINSFTAEVRYQLPTNTVTFTGIWRETAVGSLIYIQAGFSSFSGGNAMFLGNDPETGTIYIPTIEEVGEKKDFDGDYEPTLVRISGLNEFTASQMVLTINGEEQDLVTFPGVSSAYYIASPGHPGWPRVFVNKEDIQIPGVTPPALAVLEEVEDLDSFQIRLSSGSKVVDAYDGDTVKGGEPLPHRPPTPNGPFTIGELWAHFDWYNQYMLAGKVPPSGFGDYKLYYDRLKKHFLDATGNAITVDSLSTAGFWWGDKVEIDGVFLQPRTIVVDNAHQTVWEGVFQLQIALDSKEAKAHSDWTIADDDPEQDMDFWQWQNRMVAIVGETAKYAKYGAELELYTYTTILPGGQIASDFQSLVEGNPLTAIQIVKKLPIGRKLVTGPARKTEFYRYPGNLNAVTLTEVNQLKSTWPTQPIPAPPGSESKIGGIMLQGIFRDLRLRKVDFATGSGEAVFWSNWRGGNQDTALRHVILEGQAGASKKTIEMTSGGQWLMAKLAAAGPNGMAIGQHLTDKQIDKLWEQASKYFAEQASGAVAAFVRDASVERTFLKIELPRLNDNGSVTQINAFIFD